MCLEERIRVNVCRDEDWWQRCEGRDCIFIIFVFSAASPSLMLLKCNVKGLSFIFQMTNALDNHWPCLQQDKYCGKNLFVPSVTLFEGLKVGKFGLRLLETLFPFEFLIFFKEKALSHCYGNYRTGPFPIPTFPIPDKV